MYSLSVPLVPRLYLASASPRRGELLAQIGVAYERRRVAVDEGVQVGESPEAFVVRVALDKARAGLQALPVAAEVPVRVLGADTVVVVDTVILGKPCDRTQALAMLRLLSGRTHRVLSGVALVGGGHEATRLSTSRVCFRDIDEAEARDYWASGEPADKAGGYAIQGRAAVFIVRLEGSYSGVMGLPLYETAELLYEAGIAAVDGHRGSA